MRKKIVLAVSAVLALCILIGVGTGNGSPDTTQSDVKVVSTSTHDADTAEVAEDQETTEKPKEEKKEQVLVNDKKVKITFKKLDTESVFGAEVQLLVENKTGKDIIIQDDCSPAVNGITVASLTSTDVKKGTSAVCAITLYSTELEKAGIDPENIESVKTTLKLLDSDYSTLKEYKDIEIEVK